MPAGSIVVEAEIPLLSPNRLLNEHWRTRHHRRARERAEVRRTLSGRIPPPGPWTVRITRLGPRDLDAHDTLPFSAKAVADEIATWLGVDDRDPRLRWEYAQETRRERARPLRSAKGATIPARTKLRIWCRIEIVGTAASWTAATLQLVR